MPVAVQGDRVARGGDLGRECWPALDLLADQEERRPRASAREELEDGRGALRMRAVVEGQRDGGRWRLGAHGWSVECPWQVEGSGRRGEDRREEVADHRRMIPNAGAAR